MYQTCVCGHDIDDHEGECLVDDCPCEQFEEDDDYDDD